MAACQAALRPAWEAIANGAHKAPSPNPAHKRLAYLRSFTAAWVYTMMATIGVSLLERQRKYVEATDMLRQLLGALQSAIPGSSVRVFVRHVLRAGVTLLLVQGGLESAGTASAG